ncbi:MAG TPA: thioesterase family protein [Afipia sp.]
MEAVFRVEGNRVVTSEHAAGPWDPSMQHGGAPSALIVWAAERIPSPQPMHVARLTVDLMRPVPVAPLTIETEVVREGRKIQLCAVRLFANGVEVVRGTVLKVRTQAVTLPGDVVPEMPIDVPGPEAGREEPQTSSNFLGGVTLRAVKGGFLQLGSAAIWFRPERPMVEGATTSQAMRTALAADCSNGVSAVLDFSRWSFINADLTVTFARQPVGEWILLNSQMTLGADGAGLAVSRLGDVRGYFGQAIQCLVVEPR